MTAQTRYTLTVQAAREALAYARRCPRKYRHTLTSRLDRARLYGRLARRILEDSR